MKASCTYRVGSRASERFRGNCASLTSDVIIIVIIPFQIENQLASPTHCFAITYGLFKSFEFILDSNSTFYYFYILFYLFNSVLD